MTRDQQLKTLKNPKASKEQLREALATSLGVEYEAKCKEETTSLFNECKTIFLEAYKKHTGVNYSFKTKDGVALASIIINIKEMGSKSEIVIKSTFQFLIFNLPDWYKQNAFSLTVINNKFNEIVASIRKNGNGKQQVTSDFKARVAERIRTRQSKQ